MKSRQKAFTSLSVCLFFLEELLQDEKDTSRNASNEDNLPDTIFSTFFIWLHRRQVLLLRVSHMLFPFRKKEIYRQSWWKKKFNQWNWYRFGEHRFGGRKETREIIFPFMDLSCASSCRPFPPQQWTRNRYFEINEIRFASICQFVNWKSKNIFRSDDGERKCAIKYPWL